MPLLIALALLLAAPATPTPTPAPAPAPAPDAAAPARASTLALIDRVVAAHGGEKALEAARAVRETGTLASPRGQGTVLRVHERPGRLRVDIVYAGSRELRLLDGEHAFRNGEAVTGPPLSAMALQAARLDLPFLLFRWRETVRDLGVVERDGRKLHALGLPLGEGLEIAAMIDPESSRIMRSESSAPAGPARVGFVSVYSDFRPVAGVLFAFGEQNFANGQNTGTTTLEKIEVLPSLPRETWTAHP